MKLYFGLGISEAFAKAMSWLSLASLPFLITPSKYGEISIAYSILMIIFPLTLIGQDRVILGLRAEQDPREFFLSLSTSFFSATILTAATAAYTTISRTSNWEYLIIPAAAWALSANKLLLCNFRNKSQFKSYSYNRITYSAARFFFVIFSAVKLFGIATYILAELTAALLASTQLKSIARLHKINLREIIERATYGLPIAIHGISSGLLALSDRVLIGELQSTAAVGNYNFPYTIASALIFSFSTISLVYEPRIYKSQDHHELMLNTRSCIKKMYALGVPFSVLLSAAYYFALTLTDQYTPAPDVFFIILISHLIMPIYLTSNYTLIRAGKATTLLKCTLLAAATNIALNIVFIPIYGIVAAATTTLIGNLILAVLSRRAAKLIPPLPEDPPHSHDVSEPQTISNKPENTEKQ